MVHLQFYKGVIKMNYAKLYGIWESGRLPPEINVKLRILSFWSRIIQNENKQCINSYQDYIVMIFAHLNR